MSDEIIGPQRCSSCGGDYGQHKWPCVGSPPELSAEQRDVLMRVMRERIAELEQQNAKLRERWEKLGQWFTDAHFHNTRETEGAKLTRGILNKMRQLESEAK